MNDVGNKEVMAKNISRYMKEYNLSAKELSERLDEPYTTVLSWKNAKNYPRIDKIEKMCDIFHCTKSQLIEKPAETDGLSKEKAELMRFVQSVPEEKAAWILSLMKSILEGEK